MAWMLAAVVALLPAQSSPSAAKAFKVKRLIDNSRMRPDTGNPFIIAGPPVIDGALAVFATSNNTDLDAIWSIDITTKKVKKLVGAGDRVPHGQSTFHDFNFALPTVGNGIVGFLGTGENSVRGIYTLPIKSGKISRAASTEMKAPDGGIFDDLHGASLNGSDVVFFGHTSRGHHGIYQAPVGSAGLVTVLDERTNLAGRAECSFAAGDGLFNFDRPVIGNGRAAFVATGSDAPVNTPNGVVSGGDLIADNRTHVQSDPSDCPHMVFTQLSAAVGTPQIAFFAFDANVHDPVTGIPFQGIFLARGADKTATRLVSNVTKSPVSKQPFGVFGGFGYDETGLAFTATESTGGQGVYVLAAPGEPIHNLALDPDFHSPQVGDRSISEGVVVFSDGDSSHPTSLWVATPVVP